MQDSGPSGSLLLSRKRGLTKSYGERLRGCNPWNMNPEQAPGLTPELQAALAPLLAGIESLGEQIRESNERIEHLAQSSYPEMARLKQVKGVGTLIALTSLLTSTLNPHATLLNSHSTRASAKQTFTLSWMRGGL